MENTEWLFQAIFDYIKGAKIHHKDGSTTKSPPITSMAEFPRSMRNLEQYIHMPNNGWIVGHDERYRLQEEGVIIEPPKPKKKKRQTQYSYDDDNPFVQDNTTFVIRIKIYSTDLLRNGISAIKWALSSMRASLVMDRDQSPNMVLLGCISNVTREANEKGLDLTANYYLEMSKDALSRKNKITPDQMARPVLGVCFRFRNQRAIAKDNEDLKRYSIQNNEYYQKMDATT